MINFKPANFIEKEPEESKFFVINNDSLLSFSNEQFLRPLSAEELKWSGLDVNEKHFLGYLNDEACYVVSVEQSESILENSEFLNLRSVLGRIPDNLFEVISRSIQIINWSISHKYCGSCGAEMQQDKLERSMICKQCNAHPVYPRISPCVITLIYRKDQILLAHNVNFPENFYSTLAGFIEPGESVEAALEREVYEEVGVNVKNIEYFASQAWPFPSQLMLGYYAEYDSGEITPDKEEIDTADWFKIDNLPNVPPYNISISGMLIENYIKNFK
ncbi:NAD(+) diphosphatase [SAR86 cluster bacterium]|nr:NAD(+) diphosphatase [SAR86 cluster bacterium]